MPWEPMPTLGGRPLGVRTTETPAMRTHIAPLSRAPNTLEIFSITEDGKVQVSYWHTAYAGQWTHAVLYPAIDNNTAIGGIAAVARNSTNMAVFVASLAGEIKGFEFDNRNDTPPWSREMYTEPGVAQPGTVVRAVSRHPNLLEVFFFGPGGTVEGIFRNMNNNAGWQRYPTIAPTGSANPLTSGLAAVSRAPDNIEIWWTTTDGCIHGACANGDPSTRKWNTYRAPNLDIPGLVAPGNNAVLAAQSRHSSHMAVFYITPTGAVHRAEIDLGPNQEWRHFTLTGPVAADTTAGIACCTPHCGAQQVFWRAPNGAAATAWWNEYDSPSGWRHEGFLNGIPAAGAGALAPGSRLGAVARWPGNRELMFSSVRLGGALAGYTLGPRLPPPAEPAEKGFWVRVLDVLFGHGIHETFPRVSSGFPKRGGL